MHKVGLVVGKFYPPHRGHKYLIDTASTSVDELIVMLVGRPEETIPPALRAAWLREIHPAATVIEVDDVAGADDSPGWAAFTIQRLGRAPDVVFTSEDYGDPFSRCLGCRHVLVDRDRTTVPVSGTAVRTNPFANWSYIEPCVRAHFVKRVCVVGAESTGTTTMAAALAAHYHTEWVPEYGREYCETKFAGPNADVWHSDEFTCIARRQCEMEDAALRRADRLLFCDTAAFATSIWHARYLGARSAAVDAIAANRRYDMILLTDVDIPFVQDGLRDGEHIRHDMHEQFVDLLSAGQTPWHTLSGPHESRLESAVRWGDDMLFPRG